MGIEAGDVWARLGARVDERGFREFDRAIARADKAGATAKLEAKVDEKGFLRFKALTSNAEKSTDGLIGKMRTANTATTFFSRTIGLIKWPALITGAGLAAGAIGSLTGGVVALTSALAPLSGAVVAMPAIFGAFGQAAGTVALAGVSDLGAAVGGLNEKLDAESDAFKRLSPQAQAFARRLDTLKGPLRELQSDVQGPLFAGLDKGLGSAMKNFGPFRRVLISTSEVLGGLAAKAGAMFGEKGFGKDFEKIGSSNSRLLDRLGTAGLKFGDALRHVMVAARPFIRWLGDTAVGWGEWARGAAKSGRESGKLAKFFDQTRKTAERLGSIISHLAGGLGEIGKAAAPLGRMILRAFDDSAKGFEKWTKTKKGRDEIAGFFKSIKGPLFEMGRLVGDITKGLLGMGTTPALKQMIHALRVDLLPVLLDVIEKTTEAFGPVLIDALVNIVTLMGDVAGTTGPLNLFVKGLGGLAGILHDLFEASPFVKSTFVTLSSGIAVISGIGMMSAISNLFGFRRGLESISKVPGVGKAFEVLKAGLNSVATKAGDAAALASAYVGDFARGLKARGKRIGVVLKGLLARGATYTAAAASAVGEFVGSMVGRFRGSKLGQKLAPIFKRVALQMGKVMAAATAAAVVVGEGIGGAGAALTGMMRKRMGGKMTGLGKSFGKLAGKGFVAGFVIGLATWGDEIRAEYDKIHDKLEDKFGVDINPVRGAAGDEPPGNIAEAWDDFKGLFGSQGGIVTDRGIVGPFLGFMGGGTVPGSGSTDTVPAMLTPGEVVVPKKDAERMRRGKGGGVGIGEEAAKDSEKQGKRIHRDAKKNLRGTVDEVDRSTKRIRDSVKKRGKEAADDFRGRTRSMEKQADEGFGSMAKTAEKRSRELSGSVSSSMRSAASAVSKGMNLIVDKTNAALEAFGVKPVTIGVSADKGKDSDKFAGGGMIRGRGKRDTVPLMLGMAAPGEAILSGPQQAEVGMSLALAKALGMGRFGSLGELFSGVRTPHHAFAGGGWIDPAGPGTGVVNPKIAGAVGKWSTKYNAAINYGYDPGGGHVSPGHNVTGTATDTGPAAGWGPGPTALFERGLQALVNAGLSVLYGSHGVGTPFPNHGYGNHAHIEWGMNPPKSLGGGIGGIPKLLVKGPKGPLTSLVRAVLDKARGGATRFIGKKSAAAMPGVGGGFGQFGDATAQGSGSALMKKISRQRGWNFGDWWEVDRRETGHGTDLLNESSGAALRGQFMPGITQGSYGPGSDPGAHPSMAQQIVSMAAYIAERYGNPTAARIFHDSHNWYAQGGYLGGVSSLLGTGLGLNRSAAQARGRGLLGGIFGGRLGALMGAQRRSRRYGKKADLADQIGTAFGMSRSGHRGPNLARRFMRSMPSGFDQLTAAAQLAPGATERKLASVMARIGRAGVGGSYARARAAQISNTIGVSRAQSSVFSSMPAYAGGGIIGGARSGAGGGMVFSPRIVLVAEGDASLMDLRIKRVAIERENEVAREAGLGMMTPGHAGDRGGY